MKKVLIVSLMVLLGILLVANIVVLIQTSVPSAYGDQYMAGNFDPEPFCKCPVAIGNCVCVIKEPGQE
ncbi:MAG: hypothetical protein ACOC56_05900 [Atribacterota bacterium]